MTLQQLEYIIAVDAHRHFQRAADSCGISQSTLSTQIRKLEEELDIVIFDRNNFPVRPTISGEQIIHQAKVILYHSKQLHEMSLDERKRASGHVRLGISPTISPYIIPKLFRYIDAMPDVTMDASEPLRDKLIRQLKNADIDMAIMSLVEKDTDFLEVPLYHEKFLAYVSPNDPLYKEKTINSSNMPTDRLWALKNELCYQQQVMEFYDQESQHSSRYAAGNLATLIRIVNENSGFTIIPELHIPMLHTHDLIKIRPLVDPVPIREVSIFVRRDFVREKLLNIIIDGIKTIIPSSMLNERITKFQVRL